MFQFQEQHFKTVLNVASVIPGVANIAQIGMAVLDHQSERKRQQELRDYHKRQEELLREQTKVIKAQGAKVEEVLKHFQQMGINLEELEQGLYYDHAQVLTTPDGDGVALANRDAILESAKPLKNLMPAEDALSVNAPIPIPDRMLEAYQESPERLFGRTIREFSGRIPADIYTSPHVLPVTFETERGHFFGEITKEHLLSMYNVQYHRKIEQLDSGLYIFDFNERIIIRSEDGHLPPPPPPAEAPAAPPAALQGLGIIGIFTGEAEAVTALARHPLGLWIAAATQEGSIELFRQSPNAMPSQYWQAHKKAVTALAFHPNGSTLASASHDGSVTLWRDLGGLQTPKAKALRLSEGTTTGTFHQLGFVPHGELLIAVGDDGLVVAWGADSGRRRWQNSAGKAAVLSMAFHPTGNLMITGDAEGHVALWDLTQRALKPTIVRFHDAGITQLAISPDGQLLVSTDQQGVMRLWSLETKELRCSVRASEDGIVGLALSPNSRYIATSSPDKCVKLWSLADGKLLKELEGFVADVPVLLFSPDGTSLLAGTGHQSKIITFAKRANSMTLFGTPTRDALF